MLKKINHLLQEWVLRKDVYITVGALTICYFLQYGMHYFFPEVGEPSFYWIYAMLFGLTMTSVAIGWAYLMYRLIFPKAYHFLQEKSQNVIDNNLTPWQKLCFHYLLYAFFILVFLIGIAIL